MRHTARLFEMGLKQTTRDGMLLILIPAPFFVGLFFKLAVPLINAALIAGFSFSLTAWYGLIDAMLICLTPMFTAMLSAFLLLDERDAGLNAFYQISPVQGCSYLFARIGLPMLWAFVATLIVSSIFNISRLSFGAIFSSALVSGLAGVCSAMMIVSFSGNRVEGLAFSKLMGISFMGVILIWFIPAPYSFFLAFLPSFWVGKILLDGPALTSLLGGVLSCCAWIALFTKKFLRRA